jgi:BirA family biotin operon repressor/biotin-[acetyl-CoA-carboxylase] ligase
MFSLQALKAEFNLRRLKTNASLSIHKIKETRRSLYLFKDNTFEPLNYLISPLKNPNRIYPRTNNAKIKMNHKQPVIYRFESVGSTNQKLYELNKTNHIAEFSVVVSHEQTAGRGQMGNSWESQPGKNLTFSIIIRPDFLPVHHQFRITQVVTLALINILNTYTQGISIKWPNDIYYYDEKIAGILIENSLKGSQIEDSIIGIGLNVNQTIFISDSPNPVSLKQITDKTYDTSLLLNQFIREFIHTYDEWLASPNDDLLHQRYMDHLYRKDGPHRFIDDKGIFTASIKKIEPTGHLVLETESGELRNYAFKEVSFDLH